MKRQILLMCASIFMACEREDLLDYDCSVFPDPATSPYVLPWSVGETYPASPHAIKDRSGQLYAIDVLMPIGTPLRAARDGRVVFVEERYVDYDTTPGHENVVIVDHGDGTAARYFHLTFGGAIFTVGDVVRLGELIAFSGHTGNSTEPHLHFDVIQCCEPATVDVYLFNQTVPVSFRNATPIVVQRGDAALNCGLKNGVFYTAAPYSL
ncbi:MAG TPA: M23 family metallopeptidase [Steroidobacteraceae bacterium]|nr:M23 family metallopeptidase [Steroidobacteraceae bacterium]